MGCEAKPICLNLDTGCLTTDTSNFVVSILILTWLAILPTRRSILLLLYPLTISYYFPSF